MSEKKCVDCDEIATNHLEGKWRCWKHHSEAKQISNTKFARNEVLKKIGVISVGVIVLAIGALAIITFFTN